MNLKNIFIYNFTMVIIIVIFIFLAKAGSNNLEMVIYFQIYTRDGGLSIK